MEPTKNRINETIESLDGISPAKANPFLYDKVLHRMRSATETRMVKPATVRMALAIAVVLVAVNAISLLHYSKSNTNKVAAQNSAFESEYFSYITNF